MADPVRDCHDILDTLSVSIKVNTAHVEFLQLKQNIVARRILSLPRGPERSRKLKEHKSIETTIERITKSISREQDMRATAYAALDSSSSMRVLGNFSKIQSIVTEEHIAEKAREIIKKTQDTIATSQAVVDALAQPVDLAAAVQTSSDEDLEREFNDLYSTDIDITHRTHPRSITATAPPSHHAPPGVLISSP